MRKIVNIYSSNSGASSYYYSDSSRVNNWSRYGTNSIEDAISWFKNRAMSVKSFPCQLLDTNMNLVYQINDISDISKEI
jgi:hypothetical protein